MVTTKSDAVQPRSVSFVCYLPLPRPKPLHDLANEGVGGDTEFSTATYDKERQARAYRKLCRLQTDSALSALLVRARPGARRGGESAV
jgi:hypothetical protein